MPRTFARLVATAGLLVVGALPVVSSAAPAGAGPAASPTVAITTVSVLGEGCYVATLDVTTGELAQLGPSGAPCPMDYAPAPDGRIFALRPSSGGALLATVDPTTGEQTVVGGMGFQIAATSGIEFDAAGNLWFTGNTNDSGCGDTPCLYSVDPTTGATSLVGSLAESETQVATPTLARYCDGPLVGTRYEYPPTPGSIDDGTEPADDAAEQLDLLGGPSRPVGDVSAEQVNVSVLTHVDTSTPALTEIGSLGGNTVTVGTAFAPDGTLYAITARSNFVVGSLYVSTVDPATGLSTEGPEIEGVGPPVSLLSGLTFLPYECAAPAPIVLEPTFTG